MPYLFITTANMISQHATLENFEKFIGPLYTVLMAFSIYLFITYDPNAEDCEECEEEKEECEEEKEECEEEQEECEEEQEECEEEQGQDEKDEDEEEIVKSQEIHEHYTVNIQKDILKRLSFLERLFRDLATSEHRMNSAILDAMVIIQRAWRSALRKSLIPICFHCYIREGSGWKKAEVKKQHITRYIDECGECGNIICVSEVEGTVNHDLLTPRKERKLAFFIEREVLKRGDHPFR